MSVGTDSNRVMYLNSLVRRDTEASWSDKKAIRAVVFGTDCKHILPINILQKEHAECLGTIDDLDLTKWLSNPLDMETGARADCLDDRVLEVDRFPFDSKFTLSASYTILWSHQHRINFSIPKLSRSKIHWGAGNIVVIKRKAGAFCYLLDIEEADLNLIGAIVLSAIEVGKMNDGC
ncbi:hypothetical protein GALMADRAFT_260255 [Galerina marginata CBS 339.88]|uniref:Uncharacterized protein n=1 Tax=Galerina marginata (strain CBS 339.88) TaxID=685588 RepID=A0A067S3G5_GALM3|nr:hypothetical protein GALMADRAFT_260255 [Galerina marginata CBS 339.88]